MVVGSPEYFARHGRPRHPRELQAHSCVRFRFMTSGAIYRWEFYDYSAKQWFEVNVGGNLIVNDNRLMLAAARAGVALSRVRASIAAADISAGHLETVLNKWLPPTNGWYLYYPSRFQVPPKLRVFIDFMRERLSDLSGEHL